MRFKRMSVGVVLLLFAVIVAAAQKPAPDAQLLARARAIHERAITLDSHVDISGTNYATPEVDPGIDNPRLKCDLTKMERGGMKGVFLAVFVAQTPNLNAEGYKRAYEQAIPKFEALARLTQTIPGRCALPGHRTRWSESPGAGNGHHDGRRERLSHRRGPRPDPEVLRPGARYITLAHSGNNQICDSSSAREPRNNGLSEFDAGSSPR
jgi:hypothetical protein